MYLNTLLLIQNELNSEQVMYLNKIKSMIGSLKLLIIFFPLMGLLSCNLSPKSSSSILGIGPFPARVPCMFNPGKLFLDFILCLDFMIAMYFYFIFCKAPWVVSSV